MKSWNPIVLALCAVLLVGCASSATEVKALVKTGDTVKVDYTCRFKNGELAATSLADAAHDSKEIQSPVFRSPEKFAPFVCQVGEGNRERRTTMGATKIIGFEAAIQSELNKQLAGLPYGKTVSVELNAEANETLLRDVRYYTQSRSRTRKKERRQSLKKYMDYHGSSPAVGDEREVDRVFTATVTRVDPTTDTMVTRITPKPGATYPSDFGSATIVDGGDVYRIVFDVAEGQLVRSGNWLGRIDHVDKYVFTVDWGHPFGHEVLSCEVTVNPTKNSRSIAKQ